MSQMEGTNQTFDSDSSQDSNGQLGLEHSPTTFNEYHESKQFGHETEGHLKPSFNCSVSLVSAEVDNFEVEVNSNEKNFYSPVLISRTEQSVVYKMTKSKLRAARVFE